MLHRVDLYCPSLRRKVRLQVSIPSAQEDGVVFDVLYVLDGQNAFKNNDAAFGRSIHLGKYLSAMASQFGKRICGVAIWNAGSEAGRTNEYAPFLLTEEHVRAKNDPRVFECFTYDFRNTIIPYVQSHYPVSKDPRHAFLLGSSLGALYASYFGNAHPEAVSAVGLFSNAPFLAEKEYYAFLKKHLNKKLRTFLSVGAKECSDGVYDSSLYLASAKKLYSYLKRAGVKVRLRIDLQGEHNEESWERQILPFLSFVYFDDVEASA